MFPKIFQAIKVVINMARMYVYTARISNSVTKQYFCYSLRYDEIFQERIIVLLIVTEISFCNIVSETPCMYVYLKQSSAAR